MAVARTVQLSIQSKDNDAEHEGNNAEHANSNANSMQSEFMGGEHDADKEHPECAHRLPRNHTVTDLHREDRPRQREFFF